MLYMSPRNSIEGHLAVLKASDCKIWLRPSTGRNDEEIIAAYPMKIFPLPDLIDLLNPDPVEHYHYTRGWELGQKDPGWVLHTSGSTGLPKPIVKMLASASATESHRLCDPVSGKPLVINDTIGARIYITFPLFHVSKHAKGASLAD
jgi:acyl-CoA synthetase (AMP-forming)/AMP-acid ligase II